MTALPQDTPQRKPPGRARLERDADAPSMWSQLDLLIGTKRRQILAYSAITVFATLAEALTLVIIANVATDLVTGKKHQTNAKAALFSIHGSVSKLLLIGAGLAVLRIALQWPLSMLPARISADVQGSLRQKIFRAFTRASWEVQSADKEGQLQEVMTSQVTQATGGALQATGLINSSLTFLVLMAVAIKLNPVAAGAVALIAVGMFSVLRPIRSLGGRRARELSAAQVRYAGGVAETNRLAEETRVFGVTEAQYERISDRITACRELFYRTQLIVKLVPNLYISLIFLILVGALAAVHAAGAAASASLGASVFILVRAAQAGQLIQSNYQALQQSLPFIDRIQAAVARYSASSRPDGELELEQIRTLAFESVAFSYTPERPVLESVSFAIESGEAIGVIGPSGAGKSTLVQILLRLRRQQGGAYLVNDRPVEDFRWADWQRLVSYVPQDPRLMHGTVAENIRFFRDVTDEDVERAARLARIHDDIASWPAGYETIVGPRADAVSGGQQQRICLARALVARPQVLVLDEPTSALDPSSETLIQESLTALKSELTIFTIAHRMSTLDMCDRVMVVLDGRVVAFDTKEQLGRTNDYYRSAAMIAAGSPLGALPETV